MWLPRTALVMPLVRPFVKTALTIEIRRAAGRGSPRNFCALDHARRKPCANSRAAAGTGRANSRAVVAQHMSRPVAAVSPGTPLAATRERLYFMSCLVVTAPDGAPLGLFTRSDFLRAARLRATLA